jgi:hypothetical protein
VLDGEADTIEMSLADLKAQIADLSKLVNDFSGVFAYCWSRLGVGRASPLSRCLPGRVFHRI